MERRGSFGTRLGTRSGPDLAPHPVPELVSDRVADHVERSTRGVGRKRVAFSMFSMKKVCLGAAQGFIVILRWFVMTHHVCFWIVMTHHVCFWAVMTHHVCFWIAMTHHVSGDADFMLCFEHFVGS